MGVRNVVFDVGGVLLDWDPRFVYRELIPDPGELERFLAEVCTMEWNSTLDAGRPIDEACAELAARWPEHAELVHAWKRQGEMIGGEIPGVGELVRRLREQAGVGLYLLTNVPAEVMAARFDRYDLLGLFDGAVVSGEERLLKPSPEIYQLLVRRYGLAPGESLFVDDVEANVEAARALGFHGHRFVDAPTLAAALREHGLLT